MIDKNNKKLAFKDRINYCQNNVAKKLCKIAIAKSSNLILSADFKNFSELTKIIKKIGDKIVVLKTHIDIFDNFNINYLTELKNLSQQYNFLLFEDRKFADIGKIVTDQYCGGLYKIIEWADLVTAHIFMGEASIEALRTVGLDYNRNRGLLLIAEMSSKGLFFNQRYKSYALEIYKKYSDFIVGFVTQQAILIEPCCFNFTPGVNIAVKNDDKGQHYRSPEQAITEQLNDFIIVGRGIIDHQSPEIIAETYRQRGWLAYNK